MAIVVSKMPNNYGIRGQEFVGKNRVVYAKEKSKYPSKIEI